MRKVYLLVLVISVFACSAEVEINTDPPEPILQDVIITEDVLDLSYVSTKAIFYNNSFVPRFFGINNNQQIEIPVTLDIAFNLPEYSYGYSSSIEEVIPVNNRYDLLKGKISKFLSDQQIERNDTIFSIQGFYKETDGDYLLFDKETFNFIELEDGFYLNESFNFPLQIIDNKLYYIKNSSGLNQDEIKFIDLNNINANPQNFYTAEYITRFLLNTDMDLFYTGSSSSENRYISHQSGNELIFFDADNPLKSHFVGLDGQFYAQNFFSSLEQPVKGFYSVDVQSNTVNAQEIFSFNSNNYPDTLYLGNADIVIPNASRNSNLVISTNTGSGSMYIYELNTNSGTINPLDIEINGTNVIGYYENNFFVVVDYSGGQGNFRLRKIDLSNYTIQETQNIGPSLNGVSVDKTNGSVYYLITSNDGINFVEISANNAIEIFELTDDIYGHFSVIN